MKVPTAHVITTAGHIKKLALVIAIIGTVASYGTQVGLLMDHGFNGFFAALIPGTVDILAICAAMALQLPEQPEQPRGDRKVFGIVLTVAVAMSATANVVGAHNVVSAIAHVWPVVAYLLGELIANRVRSYAAKLAAKATPAIPMVAKADADAALAMAMAEANAAMVAAVAAAVATTEQEVRAALAAETAALLAEAERATRDAAAAESAARAEAARVARERETAARLATAEAERAAAEAERQAMAEQLAKAATAKPVAKAANVATPRVASGQASATALAILAGNVDMATEDVVAAAAAQGVELSTRTVRRVKLEMRMATAAA